MADGGIIVAGGTFGLGREITLCLAEKGWPVLAFGLETRQVSSVAQNAIPGLRDEVERAGLDVTFMEADVSSEADVARVVAAAIKKFGRIQGVVNNAAIGPLGTVLDTDPDLWDQIMAVNLRGPYLMARAVIPHMAQNGGGSIVNVGSGSGWGKANMAAYGASKGGLYALTTALSLDHFNDQIRVNSVVPGGGGIVGGISLGRVGGERAKLGPNAPGSVAGRVVNGYDLGNTIAFLMSDGGQAISGTVIDVGCFAGQGDNRPPNKTNEKK